MVNVHLLAEQDICHRKCSVAIYSYTDNGYTLWNLRYSLRTTTVIFSNESVTYNTCPNSSYPRDSYMHVTCSTWKHGKNAKQPNRNWNCIVILILKKHLLFQMKLKEIFWKKICGFDIRLSIFDIYLTDEYLISKVYNCQERDAYCSRIGNTCICQCFSGYNIINDHCLLGKIFITKEIGRYWYYIIGRYWKTFGMLKYVRYRQAILWAFSSTWELVATVSNSL